MCEYWHILEHACHKELWTRANALAAYWSAYVLLLAILLHCKTIHYYLYFPAYWTLGLLLVNFWCSIC